MSNVKKLMMTAAGGAGPDVDEVFSTHLYYGNGSNRNIVNGLDLSGEGGITWVKGRTNATPHYIANTESGGGGFHHRINDGQNTTITSGITGFNNNGFSLGTATDFNYNNATYGHFASWSFRNHPSFFKVIKYTGNGTSQTINHGLDCEVGAVLVHSEDNNRDGIWWHRELSNASNGTGYLLADSNQNELTSSLYWNSTAPTSTTVSVGASPNTNSNGEEYIMYVFAHNDGDGVFGPDGDQDIIKCGSYTGDGTEDGSNEIDLGFEPQWVMIKRTNSYDDWVMIDTMRGWVTGRSNNENKTQVLFPNAATAEVSDALSNTTSTGFMLRNNSSKVNASGSTYIYMAIRRGPMAVPESATDVFAIDTYGGTSPNPPAFNSGFPVDMALHRSTSTSSWQNQARLIQGKNLTPDNSNAEGNSSVAKFDYQDGFLDDTYVGSNWYGWMWRRAPNFFDVVAWQGSSASTRTLNHSLGVAPEMIWAKNRNDTDPWYCYHTATGNTKTIPFSASTPIISSAVWNNTTPSASTFSVGNNLNWSTSFNYIAYLFATVAGVSKVGSYTGNGNTEQNIDCGFSSGARFVLIKKISHGGNWFLFDSERGIISGNSPYLELNTTSAQGSSYNELSPYSSGFTVRNGGGLNLNYNGHTFIFYAIA